MIGSMLAACAFPEPIELVTVDVAEVVRLPNWQIEAAVVEPACDVLEEDCVLTVCRLRSRERTASSAEVIYTIIQGAERLVERETVELGALEAREVEHAFPARPVDGQTHGRCDLVQHGARVVCRVANGGAQAHEVRVVGQLTDRGGTVTGRRDSVVRLNPGERRDLRFEFDQYDVSGTCELVER